MRVLARDIAGYVGKSVEAAGWVHRIRDMGGVAFLLLRDRTGMVQLVYDEKPDLTNESVISVAGTVAENEKAPGGYEIQVTETKVLAPAAGDLPLAVNQDADKMSLEAVLDHRIVSLRMPKIREIFTVQAAIVHHFAEYMRSREFTEIKTSKLIGSGTEGGTGLFEVQYFEDTVYLAQSPQFYKQALVAAGYERVFEIGNAYRAEKHDTPRHLNEYVSLDVEMGFINSESDLMDIEIEILKSIFQGVKEECGEILERWGQSLPEPAAMDNTPRISHDDAKKIASEALGKRVFEINPESERALCDWAEEKYGVDAVFVYGFPRKKRPFYTYPAGQKTASFDLLFRGLEITTGGRRINEYDMLVEALPKFGLTEEGLSDYVQIFKYGCPPHGGFAIGLERLTQKIMGLENVKAASLFPRDRRRVRP
jgi:nondiscriminating aspartyl-tRNA synthetase